MSTNIHEHPCGICEKDDCKFYADPEHIKLDKIYQLLLEIKKEIERGNTKQIN